MSRLISRIRYRQFGVMLTTSFVDKQAYQEVVEDGHPILIISANFSEVNGQTDIWLNDSRFEELADLKF